MPHVLIVDDEADIRSLLTDFFRKHVLEVSVAADGSEMFAALAANRIDLVVLDVTLPGEDGFSLCKRLRACSDVPIIMLTAMADHVDRVVGLEVGADDYVVKPFDARELLARIRAVLRRTAGSRPTPSAQGTMHVFSFAGWRLDVTRRELRSDRNALVILSGAEFSLLLAFAEHPGTVLTRDRLLDLSHGEEHSIFDRSIDVLVGRLRRKIEPDRRDPTLIRTVRSGGYIFTPVVNRE